MCQHYSTDLSDAQWERVRPFVEKRFGRPAQVERRRIVNALLYILRTGCQSQETRAPDKRDGNRGSATALPLRPIRRDRQGILKGLSIVVRLRTW